jgi:hypothetical protein
MPGQGISFADQSGMIGFANVCGFFIGGLDLPNIFPWTGMSQMQLLCFFATFNILLAVLVTCFVIKEEPL